MGMDRRIAVPPNTSFDWRRASAFFAARRFPLKMMMIDGQLAFPDEEPPATWQELRVGAPGGMVTLRREPDGIRVVTWGNAAGPMLESWNALCWGLAVAFGGTIEHEGMSRSPDEFLKTAAIPADLLTGGGEK